MDYCVTAPFWKWSRSASLKSEDGGDCFQIGMESMDPEAYAPSPVPMAKKTGPRSIRTIRATKTNRRRPRPWNLQEELAGKRM
jgi:hypothetical protein